MSILILPPMLDVLRAILLMNGHGDCDEDEHGDSLHDDVEEAWFRFRD